MDAWSMGSDIDSVRSAMDGFQAFLAILLDCLLRLSIGYEVVQRGRKSPNKSLQATRDSALQFRFAVHAGWSRVPELWTLGA